MRQKHRVFIRCRGFKWFRKNELDEPRELRVIRCFDEDIRKRNTADEKKDRQDLVSLAKPQGGVDAMAGLFPDATPVPGVTDNGDAATRPVPTFGMRDAQGKPAGR